MPGGTTTDDDLAAAHEARNAARRNLVAAIRRGEDREAIWIPLERALLHYRDVARAIFSEEENVAILHRLSEEVQALRSKLYAAERSAEQRSE